MSKTEIREEYIHEESIQSADPSEKRLTVYISSKGLKAYLKHTMDATAGYRTLIDTQWSVSSEELLRNIESCIYDHPEVLDDYECDVIIGADKILWVPEAVAMDEDARFEVFSAVYPVDEEDIFFDITTPGKDAPSSLYFLCKGLPAFLRRTFPGARVTSHQTLLYRRFVSRNSEDPSLYADLRNGSMDVLVFRGKEFLLGAVHRYADDQDAFYHILNCLRQCGIDEKKCEVYLSGDRELRLTLLRDLREELPYVRNTMLPRVDSPKNMPTAALICVSQIRQPNYTEKDKD